MGNVEITTPLSVTPSGCLFGDIGWHSSSITTGRPVSTVAVMNENHLLCSSPEWAERLQTKVLPYLVRDVDLGDKMLEVGPGPGAATEWLRHRVRHLVTVEADQGAAERLSETYASTNVTTVFGDATAALFDEGSFDSAGCFTMLHHVT